MEPDWGDIPSNILLEQRGAGHRFVTYLRTLTGQQGKTTRYRVLAHRYEGLCNEN